MSTSPGTAKGRPDLTSSQDADAPVEGARRRGAAPAVTIVPGAALRIASDIELTARGFADLGFNGGILQAADDWETPRRLALLEAGGTIDTQEYDVTIAGGAIGHGALVKRGGGSLTLKGLGTHPSTWIAEGTLIVAGAHIGRISIGPAGILGGNGAVREVEATTGTIAPGTSTPGLLRATAVTMGPDHELIIRIAGLVGGRDYDRLDVQRTAFIEGARLRLHAIAPMPRLSRFRIVTNAIGTFARLPEGARIATLTGTYAITYRGGPSQRDVVLIAQ